METEMFSKQELAGLGIGWVAAAVAVSAVYAFNVPDILKIVVVLIAGFGTTLYFLNR